MAVGDPPLPLPDDREDISATSARPYGPRDLPTGRAGDYIPCGDVASSARFDDGARDVDTGIVYQPPWRDVHSTRDARERIPALPASQPVGASLKRFLPASDADDDRRARPGLRRRSAWASTLLGSLELTRQGDIALAQEEAFLPIHLRRADANAVSEIEPADADELVPA
ncbi:MAG TPA: hypothetical protein VMB73_35405 [Acetobacteraceae bacterium]|nr:hypothetical protein [Acetobacteraceae bacterium]